MNKIQKRGSIRLYANYQGIVAWNRASWMCCINDPFASKAATGFQTFYLQFCGKEHRIWLICHVLSGFHLIATQILFFADVYSSSSNVSNENTMGNHHYHHHHQLQIKSPPGKMSKKIPLNSYGFLLATSLGPGTICRSPNCCQRWWPWIQNCCLWAYFHQCFGDFMYFSRSKRP